MAESWDAFIARMRSNSFFLPATPEEKEKEKRVRRIKRERRHKLVKLAEALDDGQRELLIGLVNGYWALSTVGGESYAWRRDGEYFRIRGGESGAETHSVAADLSACSCPDARFRGGVCKHVEALRKVVGQ